MAEQGAIKYLTGYLDSVVYKEKCVEAHKLAIKALEEVQQYREIGTVEECGAAVEKQTAKKPNYDDYHRAGYRCPTCNNVNPWGYKHCKHCGQKLDWREEE